MTNHIDSDHLKRVSSVFSGLQSKTIRLILFFGIIGFILPAIYGWIKGFPLPYIQDEFAYLLAGDTYGNGKLTNPIPAFGEHFESPHILVSPSYMSKYPPLQGLFLAIGQVLFGHPIFGVYLSCGLAAAALFWMLIAWTRLEWAVLGTILMILFIGINSYWAQSYWGGMIAAAGGAVFFGGFRRFFSNQSFGTTSIIMLGGVVLVNSRPFEGMISMLPALFTMFIWVIKNTTNSIRQKFVNVVLPALVITIIFLSAMLYYNFRITNNALKYPVTEHHKQYYPTPIFVFQSINENAVKGNARIRKTFENLKHPQIISLVGSLLNLPDSNNWHPFVAFPYLIIFTPYFLFSLPLMFILYAIAPGLIAKDKWLAFVAGTIFFTFIAMSFATWWENPHYTAPLLCCFYLLMVECIRYCIVIAKKAKKNSQLYATVCLLFLLIVFSFAYSQWFPAQELLFASDFTVKENLDLSENNYSGSEEALSSLPKSNPTTLIIPSKPTVLRNHLEKLIENRPERYIIMVSYADNYPYEFEIVYNKSDIENAKIIWAHDLGEEKNKMLLDYYRNRKVLFLRITGLQAEILQGR